MTISSQPIVTTYSCDGISRQFSFPYRFLDEEDLRVQHVGEDGAVTELALTSGYTVAGAGAGHGGTVTTTATYADGLIRIWLKIPTTQLNTYKNNTPFPAQSHEDALDRLTLLDAMRQEEFNRSFRVTFNEQNIATLLPPIDQRAGKLWACDGLGSLVFVPTVKGDDTLSIDAASIYWDYNDDAHPRLVIDASGAGSAPIEGAPNPGGPKHAIMMIQDDVPLVDSGQSRIWIGMVFRGWPEGETPPLSDKHSRYAFSVVTSSEVSAPTIGGELKPQEIGCMALVSTAAAGTDLAKVETLVVSAREDDGLAGPSKGVAIQAITVRTTSGPTPDDRSQIIGDDDDETAASGAGSFTLRLNGGTVGGTFGGHRSWSAVLASGRAGYFNGVVLGNVHHFHDGDGPLDPEGVAGWGGVWGGRSFWHQETFAVYAKDACPGWVCIGHDGIPDTGDSGAIAPLDIKDGGTHVLAFNGQHVLGADSLAFNGVKVVGPRDTGWTPMGGAAAASKGVLNAHTGSSASASYDQAKLQGVMDDVAGILARLKAYDQALFAHGLIGPTP